MNASVAIQVLPHTDEENILPIVDKVIAYLKASGLRCMVGPFETTVEGDYDRLMELVKECPRICVAEGAPSVIANIKISYKPSGVWTIDEKTRKHQ